MAVSEEQNQHETNHPVDENELEQYGVWVKAGPEDVIEADAEDEQFSLDDLSEEALTDAENDLLAAGTPDEATGADMTEELGDDLQEISLDDLDEELDSGSEGELSLDTDEGADDELEELTLGDDTGGEDLEPLDLEPEEEGGESPASATADEDLLTLEEDDLTIDLDHDTEELGVDLDDDFGVEPEAVAAEPVDDGEDLADLGEELSLDDLAEEEGTAPAQSEEAPTATGGGIVDDDLAMEEELPEDLGDLTLDLDELDVDAFEEPKTGSPEEPDEMEDLSALPADDDGFDDVSPEELLQDEEGELPELGAEDDGGEEDTLTFDESFEAPEPETVTPGGDDDLGNLDIEIEESVLEDVAGDNLADVSVLEERAAPAASAATPSAAGDRSVSLLENIERELSTIRSELGDLRRELGQLRGGTPAQPSPPTETGEEPGGGFFEGSEDEDETIALTGAELDNIMNTAEFTEETGQPTEIDDFIAPAEGPVLDELMPEADEDYSPVTEISLEEPQEEAEPIELDLESADSDALVGSEDEVEVLASMDIDAELADIEELEDTTEMPNEDLASEDEEINLSEAELIEPEESDVEDLLEEEPGESTSEIEELDEIDLDEPEIEELDLSEAAGSGGLEVDSDVLEQATTTATRAEAEADLPDNLKNELRSVLSYMDQLLESLPEEKIKEFARSEHFNVYRRLFEELGLEQ